MAMVPLQTHIRNISAPCILIVLGLLGLTTAARGERVLDLQFWSSERSSLALGGLWEFHAEKLLEPGQRRLGSELFLEISQPWRDYRPLTGELHEPLQRGSYVLLLKGFRPRPEGFAVQMATETMARVIVAPKYAPERAQRAQTHSFFAAFPLVRTMLRQQLQLIFTPQAQDEVWMIIVQRWQMPPDAKGSIPRLQFARKDD